MSEIEALEELLNKQEELDPELEPYYEQEGPLGCPAVRHPLVYSILHNNALNAMVNAQFKAKREGLDGAWLAKNWTSYIYLHERPYRLDAFLAIQSKVTDEQYWDLLGDIWTDSENIWQNEQDWCIALTSQRPGREAMMSDEEREALSQDLDDTFTVYRGFHVDGRDAGLSWTTNSVVAKFFARRLTPSNATPLMAKGQANKADVLAFFDGRSEQEIVIMPEMVSGIEITEVSVE